MDCQTIQSVGKYEDSRWMTLKQAHKQGYRIKKGAKSVLLEKWVWSKIVEEENENGELDENALYVHKEIDASSLLRYFGELDVDNKKVFSIRNIDEISKEFILRRS